MKSNKEFLPSQRVIVTDQEFSKHLYLSTGVVLQKSLKKSIEGYKQVLVKFEDGNIFHIPIIALDRMD